MPGPGGGSRGGGGRSGGGGGSRGGGSFGGGRPSGGRPSGGFGGYRPPRPPRYGHRPPPPHYGGYHRPRRYYGGGGGGCLGGLLSGVFSLIIVLLVVGILFFVLAGNLLSGCSVSDEPTYNENTFQDYADARYAAEFGASTAYEDNILLVFLTSEESDYLYYLAWVGDHVETDINYLFGSNGSAFGDAIDECVNQNSYRYSLDTALANVVKRMTAQIEKMGLSDSHTCEEEHIQVNSRLNNRTALSMTEDTVNGALREFTEKTGIPMVIVVEDMTEVFGTSGGFDGSLAIGAIVIVGVIALVVILSKRNKASAMGASSDTEES